MLQKMWPHTFCEHLTTPCTNIKLHNRSKWFHTATYMSEICWHYMTFSHWMIARIQQLHDALPTDAELETLYESWIHLLILSPGLMCPWGVNCIVPDNVQYLNKRTSQTENTAKKDGQQLERFTRNCESHISGELFSPFWHVMHKKAEGIPQWNPAQYGLEFYAVIHP